MNTLQKLIEKYPDNDWNWGAHGFSSNPAVTPEFVEKHMDKPWSWGIWGLSYNPSITPGFVEKHVDKPWSWDMWGLSSNPSITLEFIEKNIDKDWSWGELGLSSNPVVTPEFIRKHIGRDWNWEKCVLNGNPKSRTVQEIPYCYERIITAEVVKKNPRSCGGIYRPGGHPSITPELVDEYIYLDWKWGIKGLSVNHLMTMEFIEKHMDKPWHWRSLSGNPFECHDIEANKRKAQIMSFKQHSPFPSELTHFICSYL